MYSAAWTLMDLEREDESIETMKRLVQTFPQGLYARLAQFSIGDYAYSQQNLEEAREAYRVVVQRFPGTPEADKATGLIGELTEDIASRAYELAFVELDQGRYVSAVDGFDGVYTSYPETYSGLAALANKGVALEKLGDGQQARVAYERVLELGATDPEARSLSEFARLRLDNL
jgi:TolA-binding protein